MSNHELDNLSATMNTAWQRMQDARTDVDRAWQRRCDAREPMQRAAEAKDKAWEAQQSSWQDLRDLRDRYGPRIEDLNRRQETAYQNMGSAFDRASASHEARDGNARRHADEGHEYKAESQRCVVERRQLVEELRQAGDEHQHVVDAFRRAKEKFETTRQPFKVAKAEHERCQEVWRSRKKEFFQARDAFQRKLREVRGARIKRNEENRSLAERAGVPSMYLDDLIVRWEGDIVNIYFGGVDKPNGDGHGHYAMHISGKVTYRRDPFTPHGGQNFTDQQKRRGHRKENDLLSWLTEGFFTEDVKTAPEPEREQEPYFDTAGFFADESLIFSFEETEDYIAGERAAGHRGGFLAPAHGWIDGHPVTVAFGWGTKEGETLLADGHVNTSDFRGHDGHNHYGSGAGAHGNVKERFKYSGPGA